LRIVVRAHYSDGHTEDVTPWAKFTSSEDLVATVERIAQGGPLALVMRPARERWLDLAAGPGGKAGLLGALITTVFTAANVYLGLKVGITFASSIPAAVISMAILSAVKDSSILENNIVQTVASFVPGFGSGVAGAIAGAAALAEGHSITDAMVSAVCHACFRSPTEIDHACALILRRIIANGRLDGSRGVDVPATAKSSRILFAATKPNRTGRSPGIHAEKETP
jgi:hypothetical protein